MVVLTPKIYILTGVRLRYGMKKMLEKNSLHDFHGANINTKNEKTKHIIIF